MVIQRVYYLNLPGERGYMLLYIKGEFVGGCDIIKEMFETGELQTYLREKGLIEAA